MRRSDVPIEQELAILKKEMELLQNSNGKPITVALLTANLTADRESIQKRIDDLPAFQFDRHLYEMQVSPGSRLTREQTALLQERVNSLQAKLNSYPELGSLTLSGSVMNDLTLCLGNKVQAEVKAKAGAMVDAEVLQITLTTRLVRETQTTVREDTAKKSAEQHLNELTERIATGAVEVGLLEYKFLRTQVLGYRMQADKIRDELMNLVIANHAMLNDRAWDSVYDSYREKMPGLTVDQDAVAQRVLRTLRRRRGEL